MVGDDAIVDVLDVATVAVVVGVVEAAFVIMCDVVHVSILLIPRQKTKVQSRDCIIHFTTD